MESLTFCNGDNSELSKAIDNLFGNVTYTHEESPISDPVNIPHDVLTEIMERDQLICPICGMKLATKATYSAHIKRCDAKSKKKMQKY